MSDLKHCPECGTPEDEMPLTADPWLGFDPGCRACYNEPESADVIVARRVEERGPDE